VDPVPPRSWPGNGRSGRVPALPYPPSRRSPFSHPVLRYVSIRSDRPTWGIDGSMSLNAEDEVAEVRTAVGNFVETSYQREKLSKHRGTCVASKSVIQSSTQRVGPTRPILTASEPRRTLIRLTYTPAFSGRRMGSTSDIVSRDVDISQREEFIKLRDTPDASLIVTSPFKGHVAQDWLIAAVRRVTNPDGSFGGAIYSVIQIQHFRQLFSDLDLGPGGSVALYHTSFLLTARFPEVRVGTTTISDQLRTIIASDIQSVGFSNLSPVDGVQRTGHARKVGDLPYYISLALADDDWLGEWRQSRNQLILLSAFLIGIVLLGMLTIHRVLSHWKLSVRALAESKEHSLAQTILEEKLRELARTDSLTELLNRRAFIEAGETEFLRGKRFGPNAALLLLDIDHFKQVNDRYGHEAGDRALVSFASILKTVVRTIDVPARFGGEEFVVLLVSTDLSGAMDMAERIRDAVSQIRVTYRGGEFGFTVSIGVTAFKNEDENFSEVIRRADQGMYRAKELGRNRIVMADGIQQAPTD